MTLPGSTRSPERGKRPTAADARASVPSTGAGQSPYPPLVGSWGSGIFDDDLASDLRDEWQDALERGSSPEEATSKLLSGLGSEVADDQDDGHPRSRRTWNAGAAMQTRMTSPTANDFSAILSAVLTANSLGGHC
jgi:hypothetical protein